VATAGPTASNPQGSRDRRLQLWWWPLLDLPTAPLGGPPSMSPTPVVVAAGLAASNPQGPAIDVSLNLVPPPKFFWRHLPGGTAVNITTTSKQLGRKNRVKSFGKKKNLGPLRCQEPGSHNTITEVKSKSTNNTTTLSIIRIIERGGKSYSRVEGLRVLRLTLESLCYRAGSILNAVPGSLHRPFNGPLHHRLQGDARVTAPEAH
jgi:hypothetical protein